MLKYLLALLCLIFASCGKNEVKTFDNDFSEIKVKSELYMSMIEPERDVHGFIMFSHCDALLFSSMLSAAGAITDINAARDDNGGWHRRATQDCGPSFNVNPETGKGNSRSTVSRDMILGLFWHLYKNKDLQTSIDLMESLKGNFYFLKGEGTPGELLMNPSMLNTLAKIIKKLGGPEFSLELSYPAIFSKDQEDFVAHLSVWHILLRADIDKSISNGNLEILKYHAERVPHNPLYQAAYHRYFDGCQKKAIALLMDDSVWPNNSLPTSANHCSDWPIQRDSDSDWAPCPAENSTHLGAELPVIYNLILNPK